MKKLLILFAFLCGMHSINAQTINYDEWETIVDEQFDDNNTKFVIGDNGEKGKSEIISGRYICSLNAKNKIQVFTITTDLLPKDDYIIEFNITLLEGAYDKKKDGYRAFGLTWGYKDWNNNFYLNITANSHHNIGATLDGSDITFVPYEIPYKEGRLRPGSLANDIAIARYGKTFLTFYYNQNFLDITNATEIITPQDLMGNRVGFIVNDGVKIAVDYFKIRRRSILMETAKAKLIKNDFEGAISDFTTIILNTKLKHKFLADNYAYRAAAYSHLEYFLYSKSLPHKPYKENVLLALSDCEEALKIDPTNENAYLIKGIILFGQNEKDGALKNLSKAGKPGRDIMYEIARLQENTQNQNITTSITNEIDFKSSGSGFALSTDGYVATNWHVVDEAKSIVIQVNRNGETKDYKAKLVYADKTNDLAILKIDDANFSSLGKIPYTLKKQMLDVGTSIFAMGYPLLSSLGDEVKLTDGLISSKTGYQGDIVTYQISAPIQPGNSGGPLFDKKGNLVGITNAGIPNAENVGYAIKANYLVNLLEMLPETVQLSTVNTLQTLPFTSQVKELSKFVFIIKVK